MPEPSAGVCILCSVSVPSLPASGPSELGFTGYLGEFGLGKHLSLRQSQDYVFSPEITSTFIVFEGKQNLIIEVKRGICFWFFKNVFQSRRVFTHHGDCTLSKREEFCSSNTLLEDSLTIAPIC